MTQVTMRNPHALLPGDRVKLSTDTNRMRRVVAGIESTESATTFRTLLFVRPSNGFARHVRRTKATARRTWPNFGPYARRSSRLL